MIFVLFTILSMSTKRRGGKKGYKKKLKDKKKREMNQIPKIKKNVETKFFQKLKTSEAFFKNAI